MAQRDNSFFSFQPTLELAKAQLGDPKISEEALRQHTAIALTTTGHYLQISNLSSGIAFDGDLKAEIVDCSGEVLQEITSKCAVYEFTNQTTGTQQIAFEVSNIATDYYFKPVFFKLSKDAIGSTDVWFSNPILITDYRSNETTYFEYTEEEDFEGIPYGTVGFVQSIQLRLYFDKPNDKSESGSYYQFTKQRTISLRPLIKEISDFNIMPISNFVFRRANIMLKHDAIWADGMRITDKPVITSSTREMDSNLIICDPIECSVDENDISDFGLQIIPEFALVLKYPFGIYSNTSIENEIVGSFNKAISVNPGVITVLKNDVLFATFTEADVSIVDNEFTIPTATMGNGSYYLKITANMFQSGNEYFAGVDNDTDWAWEVAEGEYDSAEYNNDEYLTT